MTTQIKALAKYFIISQFLLLLGIVHFLAKETSQMKTLAEYILMPLFVLLLKTRVHLGGTIQIKALNQYILMYCFYYWGRK